MDFEEAAKGYIKIGERNRKSLEKEWEKEDELKRENERRNKEAEERRKSLEKLVNEGKSRDEIKRATGLDDNAIQSQLDQIGKSDYKKNSGILGGIFDGIVNNTKDFLGTAGRKIAESGASIVNQAATGFDRTESDKRTKKFLEDTGIDKWGQEETAVGGFLGDIVGGIANVPNTAVKQISNVKTSVANNIETGNYMNEINELQNKANPTEEDKARIKELQDNIQRIAGETPDARTIATDAIETGLDIVTGGKGSQAIKAATAGSKAVSEGAKKIAGKKLAKEIAKGTGTGAAIGAAYGTNEAAKNEDSTIEDYLVSAGTGAALGGALGAGGKALEVRGNNRGVANAEQAARANEVPTDATREIDLIDEAMPTERPVEAIDLDTETLTRALDAEERAKRARTVLRDLYPDRIDTNTVAGQNAARAYESATQELQQAEADMAIAARLTGSDTFSKDAIGQRLESLKSEKERSEYMDKLKTVRDYYDNDGQSSASIQSQLDDIANGKMDKRMTEPENVMDLASNGNLPIIMRERANLVAQETATLEEELSGLMTDSNYKSRVKALDEAYEQAQERLKAVPETRRAMQQGQLEEQYITDIAMLDEARMNDAQRIEELTAEISRIEERGEELLFDARMMLNRQPELFEVDDVAATMLRRDALQEQLAEVKEYEDTIGNLAKMSGKTIAKETIKNNADLKSVAVRKVVDSTKTEAERSALSKAMFKLTFSPSKRLANLGAEDAVDNLRLAAAQTEAASRELNSKIKDTLAKIPDGDQATYDNIVDYLDGKALDITGVGKEVAQDLREILDSYRSWMHDNGYETIDNYLPHIFDANSKHFERMVKDKDNGTISVGNLKHRKEGSEGYSRDLESILMTYGNAMHKKMYLEPVLKEIEAVAGSDKVTRSEAEWVMRYLASAQNKKVGHFEKAVNDSIDGVMEIFGKEGSGNYYRRVLGAQRMISAGATMGLNLSTAIRNTTQIINTVEAVGAGRTLKGMTDFHKTLIEARRFEKENGTVHPMLKELSDARVFNGGLSKAHLDENPTRMAALTNKLLFMVSATDTELRGITYMAARGKGLKMAGKEGLKGEAAEEFAKKYARKKVIDTQFDTSSIDMPPALNGPLAKSLTQLASFSAKQAEYLASVGIKMIKGKDGQYKIGRGEQLVHLAGASMTLAAFSEVYGSMMGYEPTEMIPFYSNIQALFNDKGSNADALYRSPLVNLLAGDGKSRKGLLEVRSVADLEQWAMTQYQNYIPAGSQIKKTTEGLATTSSGESRTASGKLRFLQNTDDDSKIRSAAFGQYVTENAREWIKSEFPTLSEKQTEKVDKAVTREDKIRIADFYTTMKKAPKRTTAYGSVKSALMEGNLTKARNLADEYNSNIDTLMANYYAVHGQLDEELADELRKKYINTDSIQKRL